MADFLHRIVQCPLCKEQLTKPRRLRCLHAFCEECLRQFTEQFSDKPFVACPVCHVKTSKTPAGEVNQDFVSSLDEDNFTKNVIQLLATQSERSEHCVSHPDKEEIQRHCADNLASTRAKISAVQDGLNGVEGMITPKLESVFNAKLDMVANITNYYHELKETVSKYLADQERKILHQLHGLAEAELNHYQDDVTLCSSIKKSLAEQNEVLSQNEQFSEDDASNFTLGKYFAAQTQDFNNVLQKLESDASKNFHVRFIVNENLEDKLKNLNLVKIELVSSCHRDPFAASDDDAEQEQRTGDNATNSEDSGQTQIRETEDGNQRQHQPERPPRRRIQSYSPQRAIARNERPRSWNERDQNIRRRDTGSLSKDNRRPDDRISGIQHQSDGQESEDGDQRQRRQPFRIQMQSYNSQPRQEGPPPSYPNQGNSFRMRRSNDNTSRPPSARPESNRSVSNSVSEPVSVSITPPTPPVEPSAPSVDDLPSYDEYLASTAKYSQNLLDVSRTRTVNPPPQPPAQLQQLTGFVPPHDLQISEQPPIAQPRNIRYHTMLNMNCPTDTREPRIVGIARLSKTFIVADKWNNVLKVIGTGRRRIVDTLFLNEFQPWDITTMSDIKCLVAAPKQWSLLFVGFLGNYARARLQVLGKLTTTKQYASVGYIEHTDQLVCGVCTPYGTPSIDILSSAGIVNRTFSINAAGGNLFFKFPRNIDTTDRGDIIVCDLDKRNVVFLYPFNGAFKSFVAGSEGGQTFDPQGATVDHNGKLVFVLEAKENKVLVFSYSGDLLQSFPRVIQHRDPKRIAVFYNSLAVVHGDGKVTFYTVE